MNFEGFLSGAVSIVQEAIAIRPKPKKRAQSITVGPMPADVKRRTSSPSLEGSPGEGREAIPSASPLSRPAQESVRSWFGSMPVVQAVGQLLGVTPRRMMITATAPPSIASALVLHQEVPSAQAHPARLSGSCGLCKSYEALGKAKPSAVMVEVCPGCGLAGRHQQDCPQVLGEFGISDADWQDAPRQIGEASFDAFWEARSRGVR